MLQQGATAGLHFTAELMQRIAKRDVSIEELTLHVGMGTFAPVKTERIQDHIIHEEDYILTEQVASRLAKAQHITAVGTTSVRVLESVVLIIQLMVLPKESSIQEVAAQIFLLPQVLLPAVDALITNFLSCQVPLMLVAARGSRNNMLMP